MNLTLLGLPGAGKGTQALKLCQDYSIPHIATGDIIRSLIEKRTKLGQKIEKYISEAKYIPDSDAILILKDCLSQSNISSGFVLDGYPRNLYQAEVLSDILEPFGKDLDLAFYIRVEPEDLIKRVTGRRVCIACGATYHIEYNPPIKKYFCDFCNQNLIQRADDQESAMRKRIKVHKKEIDQLIIYYQNQGILRTVMGKNIDEIYGKIKKAIEVELV
ncbi:MAG: nucleoside monophosphate kinase [Bacillota bacterium]